MNSATFGNVITSLLFNLFLLVHYVMTNKQKAKWREIYILTTRNRKQNIIIYVNAKDRVEIQLSPWWKTLNDITGLRYTIVFHFLSCFPLTFWDLSSSLCHAAEMTAFWSLVYPTSPQPYGSSDLAACLICSAVTIEDVAPSASYVGPSNCCPRWAPTGAGKANTS